MSNYPIVLTDLEGGAVVVGGGQVALRKIEGLLAADVRVTVISLQLEPDLEALAAQGRIAVLRRAFQPGDLRDARLVIAATDDPAVNQAVWREARERQCLVNVVDDPAHCTFHAPAVIRRGQVTLAIGTGGSSPALSKHLRRELETVVGDEYGELAETLAALRPRVQACIPAEEREAVWRELIAALLPLVRKGRAVEAHQAAEKLLYAGESAAAGKE